MKRYIFQFLPEFWEQTLDTMKIDFTESERKEILDIVNSVKEPGDVYPAREKIFSNYFHNKEWRWPELNRWLAYFDEINNYPHSHLLRKLFSPRVKPDKKEKAKFDLLFETLVERAKNKHRLEEGIKLGVKSFQVSPIFDGEKDLFEYGRAHSFSGYPPYIPGQSVMIRDIIPEFGDIPTPEISALLKKTEKEPEGEPAKPVAQQSERQPGRFARFIKKFLTK